MILLESGPAKTDRLYWLIVGLIFLGYAGWCVYDGAVRYYQHNRADAEKYLQRWTSLPVDFSRRFTEDDFNRVKASDPTRELIHQEFGPPLPPKKQDLAPPDAERFASIFGVVTVPLARTGRIIPQEMNWQKWKHRPDDIRMQYYMAVGVGLIALLLLYRAYKAARLHAVIDEEGMTYGGKRIAFADMVSLRDYNPKGWVDLYYRTDAGEKKLRIDNQKIARFDEIAELICQKRGFQNPIQTSDEAQDEDVDTSTPSSEPEEET